MDTQRIRLNTFVTNVLLDEETTLAPRIRIQRRTEPDLWDAAGDPELVASLVMQLAINAVESIEDNGQVTLTTNNMELDPDFAPPGLAGGTYVQLTVEDTGKGMSQAELDRLFDPAFTTKGDRRGGGMARAQEQARAMGGLISATSQKGWGTVINLYLPTASAVEDDPEGQARSGELAGRDGETVLIIDDDPLVAKSLEDLLQHLNYRTVTARNGREAVDVAQNPEQRVDIALLDMSMPVMTGDEAYPLLKEARPNMKVLLCTAFDGVPAVQNLLQAGANGMVLKPFRPSKLAGEIRQVLDKDWAVQTKKPGL